MLLYLRTSKGDINTQNTGERVGELVDGSGEHYNWAFPRSLEPYEIRRWQVEGLGDAVDVGNMLLAVKVREDDNRETDIHIGIDGFFYQRYGQRVLDLSDINSIIASACPFPVGFSYLTTDAEPTLPSFGTWTTKQTPFIASNSPLILVTRTA